MATLQQQLIAAQAKLTEYTTAESEALQANRIRMTSAAGMDREMEMSSLKQIREGVTYWTGICASLEARIAGAPTFGGRSFSVADFGN